MGPWTGTLFVVAPIAGALVDRIGERPLLVGGLALQAAGMAWIALIAEPGLAYGEMIAPLVVAGVGASMAIRRPPAQGSTCECGRLSGAVSGSDGFVPRGDAIVHHQRLPNASYGNNATGIRQTR